MALKQPQDIFRKIAVELVGEDNCPTKATQKFLEEEFSSSTLTRYFLSSHRFTCTSLCKGPFFRVIVLNVNWIIYSCCISPRSYCKLITGQHFKNTPSSSNYVWFSDAPSNSFKLLSLIYNILNFISSL